METTTQIYVTTKDFKEYERHEKNPFFANLAIEMKLTLKSQALNNTKADEIIVSRTSQELVSDLSNVLMRKTYVDTSNFTKYYGKMIGEMMNLSPRAIKCFIYCSSILTYESDFYFNHNIDFKKLGYNTKQMALEAIKELVDNRLIAISERVYMFWMNPAVVCKGDRFTLLEQFIKDENMKPANVINVNINKQRKNRKNAIATIKGIQNENKKQPEIDFEKGNH